MKPQFHKLTLLWWKKEEKDLEECIFTSAG